MGTHAEVLEAGIKTFNRTRRDVEEFTMIEESIKTASVAMLGDAIRRAQGEPV